MSYMSYMSQVVTAPPSLFLAYEEFLSAFQKRAEDANLKFNDSNIPLRSCFTDPGSPSFADFDRCLYLKGWPCRQLSKKKRLDILIRVRETFTRPDWRLTKSTVYLNYVVVSRKGAKLAQSLHYDFEELGQTGHPFFHLQLETEPIPRENLLTTGFDMDVTRPGCSTDCQVTTRIPTSDMTFTSVLYSLMADHLCADKRDGIFHDFADSVKSIHERLPPLRFEALKDSFDKSFTHFKSPHWFAHMHQ